MKGKQEGLPQNTNDPALQTPTYSKKKPTTEIVAFLGDVTNDSVAFLLLLFVPFRAFFRLRLQETTVEFE